jgi:hypothetical protein
MSEGADKLRALAKQSRTLSRHASTKERAKMLLALADLYEHQASQLELTPASNQHPGSDSHSAFTRGSVVEQEVSP